MINQIVMWSITITESHMSVALSSIRILEQD